MAAAAEQQAPLIAGDEEALDPGYGEVPTAAFIEPKPYIQPWSRMNASTRAILVMSVGYRLPSIDGGLLPLIEPSLYTVSWLPQFSAPGNSPLAYSGRSTIEAKLFEAVDCILVHAGGNLNFTSITVNGTQVASSTYDSENQRLVIKPLNGTALWPAGAATLGFDYVSLLQTNNVGLYLSTYTNDTGATVNVTATQFEATSARTAMPCFDEPALKANFSVTVDGVPAGYTALGNMPISGTVSNPDGTTKVTFQTTPRMSTYLLALVVGPFISAPVDVQLQGRTMPVTAFGMDRASVRGNIEFAAAVGASVTAYYETLFGVPFPLPKQDMIAIPDFAAGAMENWGLVTYRETAMLGSVNTSSASELSRVSTVVAHELAHQWFGDIVTSACLCVEAAMRLTYLSSSGLVGGALAERGIRQIGNQHATPEYEALRSFQSGVLFPALRADALAGVQVLTSPSVDSSAAIEAMFSTISYSKGASLLATIATFINSIGKGAPVGEDPTPNNDAFYKGVQTYLTEKQYATGKPTDLWDALASAAAVPQLRTWLPVYETRPGFALVSLDWTSGDAGATSGALQLTQTRFFQSPASQALAAANDQNITYWVPLSYKCQSCAARAEPSVVTPLGRMQSCSPDCAFTRAQWTEADGVTLITVGSDDAPFILSADGWLKLNVDGESYYRVSYPPAMWSALFVQAAADSGLQDRSLSYGDTAQLVDDLFSVAESAYPSEIAKGVNTSFAMAQAYLLINETSYEVVLPLLYHFSNLFSLLVLDVAISFVGNESVYPAAGSGACFSSYFATGAADPVSPGDVVATLLINLLLRLYGSASDAFAHPSTTGISVPPLDLQLQASLLNAASLYNVSSVVSRANELYSAGWGNAPADFQTIIISSALRWSATFGQADSAEPSFVVFDTLVEQYGIASVAGTSNASRILGVLASPYNRVLLKATLDFAMSDAVRVGDKTGLITRVAANPFGRDLAYAFITENWSFVMDNFGQGGFDLSNLITSLGAYFGSQPYADAVAAFFVEHAADVAGATAAVSAGVEAISAHINWIGAGEAQSLCAFLS